MKHEHLPDAFWDQYWLGVYNRMERGLAWVLLSIGGAILVGFGMWQLVTHLFLDADVPLLLRFGVGITIAGSAVLFVSLIRERMRMWRHDLYKEVQR